jgi:DNA-binding beta-propeller fold protein YncE
VDGRDKPGHDDVETASRKSREEEMRVHPKSTVIAAAAVVALAMQAHAQGLKQVGTIPIPGEPINQFGVLAIDQASGLAYLADKDNKGVVVFDTKTEKYVSRIGGFVGMTKSGNTSGPNGVLIVGGELWVSDGDSTIKVVDPKSGTLKTSIATGGSARANAMAFDPSNKVVIVANSNDEPPFLNLISTEPGNKLVSKIAIAESAENIERSAYHAPSGAFFTVIPVQRADKAKGLIAQTDPRSGKPKLYEIERCHPHSLSIVSDQTIFMGCSSAHGPSPKPGGDLAIFDIASGRVESYGAGLGGNGGSAVNPKIGHYYHSASHGELIVVDIKTRQPVQKVPTWNGARSLDVSLANNRVYVATTAKEGPCGGCVAVFAPQ